MTHFYMLTKNMGSSCGVSSCAQDFADASLHCGKLHMRMSMEVSLCCESWPENTLFHGLILAGVTPAFGQWEVVCDARLVGEQLTVCTCLALRETLLHIYGRKAGGWCERPGVMLQTRGDVLPPPKTQRKMV